MTTPIAVHCDAVSKHYKNFTLSNFSLSLEQGSVMGLVGPNGAGKSTALQIIVGLIGFDAGSVEVLGRSMPLQQIQAKRDIGFVSEGMRLYESETIGFHIDFVKSIFDTWDDDYATHLLKRFDLKANHKVTELSHGQRVKTTLLLALARRPGLLVLDEPTTGLDPTARKEVLDEMMTAMEDETRSILFSSHNILDVEQVADYITFLYGGSVLESQDKESYLESWRRIRLRNPENKSIPDLANIREVQTSGQLLAITVNNFDENTIRQLENAGHHIVDTERMTLEEIFRSNVQFTRGLVQ